MQKKKITALLRRLEETDAQRLSEQHLTLSEQEHERILHKIETQLPQRENAPAGISAVKPVLTHNKRLHSLSHAVVAAACAVVFFGSLAGMVWLKIHAPQNFTQTSVPDESVPLVKSHAVGERYAAENLTESGTLWLTVTDVTKIYGQYCIGIVLESEKAVSCARSSMGEPDLFFADNFQLTALDENGERMVCVPRNIRMEQQDIRFESGLPYAVTLHPGEQCKICLWFQPEEGVEWHLVSSLAPDAPYTVILTEESS